MIYKEYCQDIVFIDLFLSWAITVPNIAKVVGKEDCICIIIVCVLDGTYMGGTIQFLRRGYLEWFYTNIQTTLKWFLLSYTRMEHKQQYINHDTLKMYIF